MIDDGAPADPDELTPQEQRLIDCAARGDAWRPIPPVRTPEEDDPARFTEWHGSRTIRAAVLRCLLTQDIWPGAYAPWPVRDQGVRLAGARITGALDLAGAKIPKEAWLYLCAMDEKVVLTRAQTKTIGFRACHVPGLEFSEAKVDGGVFLSDGFTSSGEVNLVGTDIRGQLICQGARFHNPGGRALSASGLRVGASVFLTNGFWSKGEVSLVGATIDGSLECGGSILENADGRAICADGAVLRGSILLNNSQARGEIRLVGAKIGVQIACAGASLENVTGPAINLDSATIGTGVMFTDARIVGEARLQKAHIGRDLDCHGASLEWPGGYCLNCDGTQIGQDVYLAKGFRSIGSLRFRGAKIGGQFECSDSVLEGRGGLSLDCDSVTIGSSVFIRNMTARGGIDFYQAVIGGNARFENAKFSNRGGDALNLSLAKVGAGLFLKALSGDGPGGVEGRLVLGQAQCRSFSDDEPCRSLEIELDGFAYERFHDCATDWRSRLDWLLHQPNAHLGFVRASDRRPGAWWARMPHALARPFRGLYWLGQFFWSIGVHGPRRAWAMLVGQKRSRSQSADAFRPQPWTQTVKALRDMGYEDDARELAMQREIVRARSTGTRWHLRLWLGILRWTIGNGYKPQRALYWSLGFLLFSWATFAMAANMGFMAPRDGGVQVHLAEKPSAKLPKHYTRFNALVFALDTYLPIIELGQDQAWEPSDIQTGHRRDAYLRDPPLAEAGRLALGHDWSVTGEAASAELQDTSRPQSVGIAAAVAANAYWAFFFGFHRFVYWAMDILGWLFVSLYIAGMSGIVKNE